MESLLNNFLPDWASPPGETIFDIAKQRGWKKIDLSSHLDLSIDMTEDLLSGRLEISISLAKLLKESLGGSIEFWISRDYQYREDLARLYGQDEEWLNKLPYKDMVDYGWVAPGLQTQDETQQILQFFGSESIHTIRMEYASKLESASFRTSRTVNPNPAAVAAWLRKGEIEARYNRAWDKAAFKELLPQIRPLTLEKQPSEFVPKLQELCSSVGVAVVVVRAPSGCPVNGATYFIDNNPLILLSFRYLTDDQFWFTFFHESAHLLLHGTKQLFLEGDDRKNSMEEDEANNFAQDFLVPKSHHLELMNLPPNALSIARFAKKLGISPGLVVGQLQFFGKVKQQHFNQLKIHYRWPST